jgi:hypothetical protein
MSIHTEILDRFPTDARPSHKYLPVLDGRIHKFEIMGETPVAVRAVLQGLCVYRGLKLRTNSTRKGGRVFLIAQATKIVKQTAAQQKLLKTSGIHADGGTR